jgi:lathosterol oxidase
MFIFMLPLHKWTYLVLFVFVNIWSVSIHDGLDLVPNCFQNILNGSAHHTDHHLHFNYNYGQFFTLWDFVGKSHRDPHVGELSIMEKDLIRTEIPEEESELLQHLNKND